MITSSAAKRLSLIYKNIFFLIKHLELMCFLQFFTFTRVLVYMVYSTLSHVCVCKQMYTQFALLCNSPFLFFF